MGTTATRPSSDSIDSGLVLEPSRLNQLVVKAEYAVRGKLYEAAVKRAATGAEVIYTNVGNPQALGQKPITFFRQVLSLVSWPGQLEDPRTADIFPPDAVARAKKYLSVIPGGTGAYQDSRGNAYIRQEVADFLGRRDGYPGKADEIFLTDGASMGITLTMRLTIRDSRDAILLPIPQYPLYSATVTVLGGSQTGYYLDEANGWALNVEELERAVKEGRQAGKIIRGVVVINPGNPTGQCLTRENIEAIVRFCKREHICIFADEVYQENVFNPTRPFVSFRKVILDMGIEAAGVECFSFHSASKGSNGECGRRAAYFECLGIHPVAKDNIYKMMSMNLSTNVDGQLFCGLMVNPPRPGDASYELYNRERESIIASMARRADRISRAFNSLEGVSSNRVDGAMYAFPRIALPTGVVKAATKAGVAPDVFYCLNLLEETGICCIPGSGFGQADGTMHFRTTILPPEEKFDDIIHRFTTFHSRFIRSFDDSGRPLRAAKL
eukprot:Plantae.Rhodophyta-Rhodochaete_pulchella.ctg3488.p1 GENE.Plantae.Rhodophyta-Rhodochaete_pulchella.ctg3488~~Plantae.Rhodophyta-Rhodochaete_pulchella.ctg3488.p1  ORF type:complete len:511 (+),score=57.11 Plantae.Rhodophyta-Rhodochaete_pulchella.ctg3488:43-1533(+)